MGKGKRTSAAALLSRHWFLRAVGAVAVVPLTIGATLPSSQSPLSQAPSSQAPLPQAPSTPASPDEARFRELFRTLVETDTSFPDGDCTLAANRIADWMREEGFPSANIQILAPQEEPKAGNIVAVLPGSDKHLPPLLLAGHIDVVAANRADWTRDPFKLVENDGVFYARGVADMKGQDAVWVDTLVRLHAEKAHLRRTIKLALTCGEEGGFRNGAQWLIKHHRPLIDAGLAFNEGGAGQADAQGKPVAQLIEVAQKMSVTLVLSVTGPGGHASMPRPDNAIYTMARALDRVAAYSFPVQLNDASRLYFERMGPLVGGDEGKAMTALAANPNDSAALQVVSRSPISNAVLRDTCVATQIQGGHAKNALPQRVEATLNCRALPGHNAQDIRKQIVAAIGDPTVSVSEPESAFPSVPPMAVTEKVLQPVQTASAMVWPGVPVVPAIIPATTDSANYRVAGIPSYGLSGIFLDVTGNGIHGLNENVRVQSVLDARRFAYALVKLYAK